VVVVVLTDVVATRRDLEVLTFAVDMFAVPVDLVAELVRQYADEARPLDAASAPRVAQRTMRRLEASGWAQRVRVRGEGLWLVPTRSGLAAAAREDEEPFGLWVPGGWKLAHAATTARLRLHLEGAYPGAEWESERRIRRRWADAHKRLGLDTRTRYADGGMTLPDGRVFGVEVELGVKKQPLYDGFVHDVDPEWRSGVLWYTDPAKVALLAGRLARAGGGDHHQVLPLPEGVAP
jgi:hypothetical protein